MAMSLSTMPMWLRWLERIFAFNFIIFSFVMFSCWFPTGFSATFSTFAFLSALPIFFYRIRFIELSSFEILGLALFGWISLSIIWSEAPILDSLRFLSEYRIYFVLPVLISVLSLNPKTQLFSFRAAMIGAFVALVTSYGLELKWWQVEGAQFSLANRIYHGFIMSSFLLACLLISRETSGRARMIALSVALLVVYNVLNIETGRTGYLQVVSVLFTVILLSFSRVQAGLAILVALIMVVCLYMWLDRFHDQINQTLSNVESALIGDEYQSSAGQRIEYYREAINIGFDFPLSGVGVGDVVSTLQKRTDDGRLRLLTDNVHSEFMNMLVVGGFPALLIFVGFLASIIYAGFAGRKSFRLSGDMLIGLGVIVTISSIFNSTIKDYGEKHALIIMLTLCGARLLLNQRGTKCREY